MNAELMEWEVTEHPDGSIVDDVTGSTLLPPIGLDDEPAWIQGE